MLAESERMIISEDRQRMGTVLGKPRSFWTEWGRTGLVHLIFLVSACVLIGWLKNWIVGLGTLVLYVGFEHISGGLKARVDAWREIHQHNDRRHQLAAAVTRAATISVVRIESEVVVAVPHDEGTLFLFDIGDGRWFAYEPTRSCRSWPNSSFELWRIAECPGEFGPFCNGQQLEVSEFLDFKDFDFERLPDNGIIVGPLESMLKARSGGAVG